MFAGSRWPWRSQQSASRAAARTTETRAGERKQRRGGEAILIKTRLTIPVGEVLRGSSIGDSAFCPGGRFRDRHGGTGEGTVVKTFRCPGGRLTITFSPIGEQSCAPKAALEDREWQRPL